MEYTYFTFPTTYYALKAEKVVLEQKGEGHAKMVPVPRKISSSCGTALRCCSNEKDIIEELLNTHQVSIEGIYRLEEEKINLKNLLRIRKG